MKTMTDTEIDKLAITLAAKARHNDTLSSLLRATIRATIAVLEPAPVAATVNAGETKDLLGTWWVDAKDPSKWYGPVTQHGDGHVSGKQCFKGSVGWGIAVEEIDGGFYLPIPPRPVPAAGKQYRECRPPKNGERYLSLGGEICVAPGDWVATGSGFGSRRWIEEPAEQPVEAARMEQVGHETWTFRRNGMPLADATQYSTPADRLAILAALDPAYRTVPAALVDAWQAMEAWIEHFRSRQCVSSPNDDKKLAGIVAALAAARAGKDGAK
jgi:hypothetical protein